MNSNTVITVAPPHTGKELQQFFSTQLRQKDEGGRRGREEGRGREKRKRGDYWIIHVVPGVAKTEPTTHFCTFSILSVHCVL